jgi:hypothetical protein
MMRMSQRIDRSQQLQGGNNEKNSYQDNSNRSHRDQHSPLGHNGNNHTTSGNEEDKESPIVALEPEEAGAKGSAFNNTKKNTKGGVDAANQPSLYLQEKLYIK